MDKEFILSEIARTATANGGIALGQDKFATKTGIRRYDWLGKHWAGWNEALAEAGFPPNQLQEAYKDDDLLERLAGFIQEIGRFPADAHLRLKARKEPGFPASSTFRRLGTKTEIAAKIGRLLRGNNAYADSVKICDAVLAVAGKTDGNAKGDADSTVAVELGEVYLIKSGGYFKVGRSNASGRRHREIALQLPERAELVHTIRTDDPVGIEDYWHRRFAAKRKNGEWFDLNRLDVAAFRRRKTM